MLLQGLPFKYASSDLHDQGVLRRPGQVIPGQVPRSLITADYLPLRLRFGAADQRGDLM